jgi:outer membrane protein TolC
MKLIAVCAFVFLSGICFPFSSGAQQVMTLDDAISIGLKNNYDILMAKKQQDAAALDYRYAFGAFLPVVTGNASRTWSTANIEQKYSSGNSVKRDRSKSNNISLSADLDWTLFDGLRVFATKDKLKAIEEAGTLTVKGQVVNSVAQIIGAYYNIVQSKQQVESISEQMSISEERVKIASNKFTSGLGSKIDLLQAKVDLNAQKAAYLQQQTLIDENKATLNQLIALPPDHDYVVGDTIPVNLDLDYGDLQKQALSGNPDLLLAQKDIDISRLSLKEIQRSRFPTISFNSSYAYSKQSSEAGFSLFNRNKGFSYGFSASIPILEGFNITHQAKSAQLGIAYQQLNYQNQRSQVSLQLQNAFKSYDYFKKATLLEVQNLGVAEENVRVTLAAFKQGQVSSLEVKEAQQSLADARYRLISARYNAKLAETTLLQLKGNLLK